MTNEQQRLDAQCKETKLTLHGLHLDSVMPRRVSALVRKEYVSLWLVATLFFTSHLPRPSSSPEQSPGCPFVPLECLIHPW